MAHYQVGILAGIPAHAEYLFFQLQQETAAQEIKSALEKIKHLVDGDMLVLGLGHDLCQQLHLHVPALKHFSIEATTGTSETQSALNKNADLWCWLRSDERGELVECQRQLESLLEPYFTLHDQVSAFRYQGGRDLTGYEDGTENPVGEDALATAFVNDPNSPLHGSSFVAVQQWQHQMQHFHALARAQQDNIIGRRKSDNEELEDAPESAHVKRTAQESFAPEAFVLRRSMPWAQQSKAGLLFTAFATSFDAFEAQYRRMLGNEDGIVDAIFSISQPINTHYFWCPALQNGELAFG
ncbi:Dyp-type peroxidase [Undibacterium sp. LX40W]|uniref:Dyp-type peroxidase n=1 Tax=Undibacterium nitidum TaxID=2762298 RepID=A0A923HVC2_9BURK|nr:MULTISPECIES: Dyp-type peroxidase [Undibacterium]MBC3880781.1 Dyp-type peroxidase [Undibacterium nitidum]MBC3890486.1 Dyp-type peroxidase [Undibacterium sp. LX40W]